VGEIKKNIMEERNMKRILATLVVCAMLMAVYAPAVMAQDISINVVVGSSGLPPVINYQFALSVNQTTGGIVPGDDNPPYADTITDVRPIPGSGLAESSKHFKKYIVVSSPAGITDIATVYERLLNQTGGAIPGKPEVVATDITSNVAEYTAAINQAYNVNLITLADKTEMLYGLQSSKALYRIFVVDNYLTNHDTPGDYQVYFKVVSNSGPFTENNANRLIVRYMPLRAFELDFNVIEYGTIIINQRKVISGDDNWATPNRPTIKNQGNVDITMQASASNLVGTVPPIQTIPASALSVHLLGFDINSLSNTPQRLESPLVPCTPTQIDFDITAPLGISSNTYQGNLTLEMAP
jgi:hypothetical protein